LGAVRRPERDGARLDGDDRGFADLRAERLGVPASARWLAWLYIPGASSCSRRRGCTSPAPGIGLWNTSTGKSSLELVARMEDLSLAPTLDGLPLVQLRGHPLCWLSVPAVLARRPAPGRPQPGDGHSPSRVATARLGVKSLCRQQSALVANRLTHSLDHRCLLEPRPLLSFSLFCMGVSGQWLSHL
jgi:hypothetical protein